METQFFRANTLEEALSLLHQYQGDLLVVNGGTDAVLSITGKKVSPKAILQVSGLPDFHDIAAVDGCLRIGGGVTYNEMLASPLLSGYHGLQAAISHLASPAIRALGTAAGNICTAAPAADAAAMLYALEAELCLESAGGKRRVALRDFYMPDRSYATVRRPDELLTAIEVPLLRDGDGTGYCRLSRRKAQDIGKLLVGVYCSFHDGKVTHAFISLGAVNASLVHAQTLEEMLIGKTAAEAVACCRDTYPVEAKLRESYFKTYKQDVICPAVSRAVAMAAAAAKGESSW